MLFFEMLDKNLQKNFSPLGSLLTISDINFCQVHLIMAYSKAYPIVTLEEQGFYI